LTKQEKPRAVRPTEPRDSYASRIRILHSSPSHEATHTWLSSSVSQQASPSARNEEKTRLRAENTYMFRPTRHVTGAPVATCKILHRHSRHYRASSTAEPVPRLEATPRMTQQCQPGTSVAGQSAAGEGATVDTARNRLAVMAVAGGQKQRSSRQPSSRPLQGQRENPLPRCEDGAPVFHSSNSSHTRNGCPANHSSRRINSAAGQAAPLAGEAGDASPSP
jgi:hypothetical protein